MPRMTRDGIDQARDGIESKRYSLTALAKASDMPVTTLATMLEEKWGRRVFEAVDRIERLKVGMKVIDRQKEGVD